MTINKIKFAEPERVPAKKLATFETVIEYVKKMGLEDNISTAILNKARSLPPGSLEHFINNINIYIGQVFKN